MRNHFGCRYPMCGCAPEDTCYWVKRLPYDDPKHLLPFVPNRYEYPYGPDEPIAVIYPAASSRSRLDREADEFRLAHYLKDHMERARGRTQSLQADDPRPHRGDADGGRESLSCTRSYGRRLDGLAGDREYWTWSC